MDRIYFFALALCAALIIPLFGHLSAEARDTLCDTRSRSLGGCSVAISKFPWQVSIGDRDAEPYDAHRCGGSLIARDWVLTAAHCVIGQAARDLVVRWGGSRLSPGMSKAPVEDIYAAKGALGVVGAEDIALLKLDESISTRAARLARAVADDSLRRTGRDVVIIGWGDAPASGKEDPDATEITLTPDLRGAKLSIVPNRYCDEPRHAAVICTRHPNAISYPFIGHSGGPLMALQKGRYVQIAVVSGYATGDDHTRYGIFTRVDAHRPWIDAVMRGEVHPSTSRPDEPLLIEMKDTNSSTYGTVSLNAGFGPAPHDIDLLAGGNLEASWVKQGCVGAVPETPDVQLLYKSESATALNLSVQSDGDATLLVRAPGGDWYCNDDLNDTDRNPFLSWPAPESGRYRIYVGSYQDAEQPSAVLRISETKP